MDENSKPLDQSDAARKLRAASTNESLCHTRLIGWDFEFCLMKTNLISRIDQQFGFMRISQAVPVIRV